MEQDRSEIDKSRPTILVAELEKLVPVTKETITRHCREGCLSSYKEKIGSRDYRFIYTDDEKYKHYIESEALPYKDIQRTKSDVKVQKNGVEYSGILAIECSTSKRDSCKGSTPLNTLDLGTRGKKYCNNSLTSESMN